MTSELFSQRLKKNALVRSNYLINDKRQPLKVFVCFGGPKCRRRNKKSIVSTEYVEFRVCMVENWRTDW